MKRNIIGGLILSALLNASYAHATDGMNPIAFDARTAAMGGANTALGGSPLTAMTSNPATMALAGHALDLNVTLLIPLLTLNDGMPNMPGMESFNADKSGEGQIFPLFGIAYSAPVYKGLYLGLGAFVQGGMGAHFKDVKMMTQNGPVTYEMKSKLMYIKLSPSIAYRYKDFMVGASFHVGMAKMEWKHTLMDADYSSDFALGFSGRFGFLFSTINDRLSFGASYMTKATPTFEGDLKTSQGAVKASTEDFSWAQELALGVSGKLFNRRLVLSADFRWVNWSNAVETVTFAGDQMPQPMPFVMNWQDSLIFAVGAEWALVEEFLYGRIGYNYGREPATPDGVNPLFAPVNAHHITLGLGAKHLVAGLNVNIAFEYALPGEVKSSKMNQMGLDPVTMQPTGYQFAIEMQQISLYVGLGYDF